MKEEANVLRVIYAIVEEVEQIFIFEFTVFQGEILGRVKQECFDHFIYFYVVDAFILDSSQKISVYPFLWLKVIK